MRPPQDERLHAREGALRNPPNFNALLGAKVLSVTLPASGDDVESGLQEYAVTMRPLVEHFQHNAVENVDNALPVGHLKNVLRSWVVHLLPPSLFARHFRHQFDVEAKLLGGFV